MNSSSIVKHMPGFELNRYDAQIFGPENSCLIEINKEKRVAISRVEDGDSLKTISLIALFEETDRGVAEEVMTRLVAPAEAWIAREAERREERSAALESLFHRAIEISPTVTKDPDESSLKYSDSVNFSVNVKAKNEYDSGVFFDISFNSVNLSEDQIIDILEIVSAGQRSKKS